MSLPPVVNADALKELLGPLLDAHPDGAVVFDADGTLWSHDVGCMVFDAACDGGLFRAEAYEPLVQEARRAALATTGTTANDIARTLQAAWYDRRYGERAAAEMQVWAYVGFTEAEFRLLARDALEQGGHMTTLHEEIVQLAQWVRDVGRRACVVSASPLWVIQEGTRRLGFSDPDIAAGIPNTLERDGLRTIAPGMAKPLPYGMDKVHAGRALLAGGEWICALGDSAFDLEMMRVARVGVGVGRKAAMLGALAEMPHGVHLRLSE